MLRFSAFASVIYGAQALWWEGVGACAPIGSPKFDLIASINNRVAMWADPLFLKSSISGYTVREAWSTSSIAALPPLVSGGVSVAFNAPGGETSLVVDMSPDLIALRMDSTVKGKPPYLLFISTQLSLAAGGAGIRDVEITLEPGVGSTTPIANNPAPENDPQANNLYPSTCKMHRLGSKLPLKLAGGGAQLVGYTMELPPKNALTLRARAPLRPWSPF